MKPRSKTLLSQAKLTLEAKKSKVATSKKSATSAARPKPAAKTSADSAIDPEPLKKPAVQKQAQKPKIGKKRPIKTISLSSDDEEDGSPPTKRSPAKKSPAKESVGKKRSKKAFSPSSEDDDSDEDDIQPLKKRSTRQAAQKKVCNLNSPRYTRVIRPVLCNI